MEENKENKNGLWSLTFVMVLAINALNAISSYMINPILPEYLVSKGIGFGYTGLVSSLMSWVSLFFTPVSGFASDRFSKKKMLILSFISISVSMFLYTVFSGLSGIVLVRMFHGLCFALTSTLSLAFASEFVSVDQIAEGMAYLSLGQLIGSMFGPQIGSSIYDFFGGDAVFYVSCLLNIMALAMTLFLPYKTKQTSKGALRIRFSDLYASELNIYVILITIFSIANGIISYYLKDFGRQRNILNVSLFFTVNSLFMAFSKPFSSRIHDRKGIAFILYPAFAINALSMIAIANSYALPLLLAAAVLKALGQGCGSPAIQAESVKILGDKRSGVAVSTCLIGQNIGNAIGPIIGNQLIVADGYTFVL